MVEYHWDEWGNWTLCSVTCGNGQRSRSRACVSKGTKVDSDRCEAGKDTETAKCMMPVCPVETKTDSEVSSKAGVVLICLGKPHIQLTHTRTCTRTHTHTHTHTHTRTHARTHTHTRSLARTHSHTLALSLARARTHTHTCTHTYTHTHTHTCMHTHARMQGCMHAHTYTHMHAPTHTCTHAL